ncbi:MAG: nucleotidyltransferase family protein [Actinobacteria bacterium]|nr:MAG: nucleotidyltransferase family protein [Actinomycetota bacterium]
MGSGQTHAAIAATLRKATAALRDAGVPFMLSGSFACWARGGPRSQNDLDLMLHRADAERALAALESVGMRGEHPPEEWLLKAWDDEVMVDLIFESLGVGEVTPEMIERAERMSVLAISMPVMSIEDILVGKLLAISEQKLDYGPLLEIARSLRESIDWSEVRARIHASPYARAFFALLAELDVVAPLSESYAPPARPYAGQPRPPRTRLTRRMDLRARDSQP